MQTGLNRSINKGKACSYVRVSTEITLEDTYVSVQHPKQEQSTHQHPHSTTILLLRPTNQRRSTGDTTSVPPSG